MRAIGKVRLPSGPSVVRTESGQSSSAAADRSSTGVSIPSRSERIRRTSRTIPRSAPTRWNRRRVAPLSTRSSEDHRSVAEEPVSSAIGRPSFDVGEGPVDSGVVGVSNQGSTDGHTRRVHTECENMYVCYHSHDDEPEVRPSTWGCPAASRSPNRSPVRPVPVDRSPLVGRSAPVGQSLPVGRPRWRAGSR